MIPRKLFQPYATYAMMAADQVLLVLGDGEITWRITVSRSNKIAGPFVYMNTGTRAVVFSPA